MRRRIVVSALLSGRDPDTGRLVAQPAPAAVRPLTSVFTRQYPDAVAELEWISRTYRVAEYLHGDQKRKTGAPYITHPLAVATILAELGMDTDTIVAALLHDTVEDTEFSLEECTTFFGDVVTQIVEGVTKLDGNRLGGKQIATAETYRKMVLAAAADLRVLLIKLVDRLHNLRTLDGQPPHKRQRIAQQSMDLLIPFADRLGLHRLKSEMEDLCFQHLWPEEFNATARRARAGETERARFFADVTGRLADVLRDQCLRVEVTARNRHLFSVYSGGASELTAGRVCRIVVVLDDEDADQRTCWMALGAVHEVYTPIPGRMKDYLSAPKYNLYQALHTSVVGPGGEPVDVLIRTRQMEAIAESGIAATIREASRRDGHARGGGRARGRADLDWLQQLLSWQGHISSEQYLDELREGLRAGGIVVITSGGQFVALQDGATGVDFAFTVDGVGGRLIGLTINGRPAMVTSPLRHGDVVEAITSRHPSAPPMEWLAAARTPQARSRIRALLELDDYTDTTD